MVACFHNNNACRMVDLWFFYFLLFLNNFNLVHAFVTFKLSSNRNKPCKPLHLISGLKNNNMHLSIIYNYYLYPKTYNLVIT